MNREMKPCCGKCNTPSVPTLEGNQWWCRNCGAFGTRRADGSVYWQCPEAPAMEYDGAELIAGTRRFKLVEVT